MKNRKPKTDQQAEAALPLRIFRAAVFFCMILVIILFAARFPAYTIRAKGHSMDPGITAGDYAVVNRMAYLFSRPERFDVIAFTSPKDGEETIKRIIGLPGESVEIAKGIILIDGQALDAGEDLLAAYAELKGYEGKMTLGENEYYVLGDAPSYSEDSRSAAIGAVEKSSVTGKVWLRFRLPFSFALTGA